MEFSTLAFGIEGRVASAVLTRGDSGNLIDRRCLDELAEAATLAAAVPDLCVLCIAAEGPDFCLGWQPETRRELLDAGVVDGFAPLASLAAPVLAAVQGACAGAGLELALACDIRIAAADARFLAPEPSEGLLPLAGATQRLPRIAGRTTALAMLLLGEELDAAAALRTGLVSRVVARAALAAEIEALARRLAERGPLALRYAKEAVHRGLELSLQQGLLYEADLSVILQTTADRAEGVRAFLEKREPRFEGR